MPATTWKWLVFSIKKEAAVSSFAILMAILTTASHHSNSTFRLLKWWGSGSVILQQTRLPFFLAWELEFTRKATGTKRWITTRWFTVHAGAFRTLPPGFAKPEPSIHPPVAVPVASILLCRPY